MKIFLQVSLGVEYLHRKGVLHGDISASNVFLKHNYEVRIGDFGKSSVGKMKERETLKEFEEGKRKDVAALGSLLVELCVKNNSFKSAKGGIGKKGTKKGT